MCCWRSSFMVLASVLVLNSVHAQEPKKVFSPRELASLIDRRLEEKWKEAQPAPRADDAEFLRRIFLDLAGRIPRVSEVWDFLGDSRPDKRELLIDKLLDSPQHIAHLGNTWRSIILPPTNNNQLFQFANPTFKAWVEDKIRKNTPYDDMVREVLTASLGAPVAQKGRPIAFQPITGLSPVAFFQANELKPENLASSTSRIFLGVRLECAQCHDHPFARWTRSQFWEMAAFFSQIQPQRMIVVDSAIRPQPQPPKGKIKIPGTDKEVQARFLDGNQPDLDKINPQKALADWVVSPQNPFFARTGANRLWAHFFGLGLNDPVDDEATEENPISHPELLEELTQQFIEHKFDIKYLIRAIANSQAYQRTSVQTHASQADARLFARMSVRGLTPEQFFDSLALAVGYANANQTGNAFSVGLIQGNPRNEFLNRFASQEPKTEKQFSILQALALMNGKFVADATSLRTSTTLAAVVDAPFLTNAQKVEALFLLTLSRPPRPEETQRLVAYVEQGGPRGDAALALTDVFWVLLNSSEFSLNH